MVEGGEGRAEVQLLLIVALLVSAVVWAGGYVDSLCVSEWLAFQ